MNRTAPLLRTAILFLGVTPLFASALTFPIPENDVNIIGKVQMAQAEPGDNFSTIGRRFDVGYFELVEANPEVSPKDPPTWGKITIPSEFVLPTTQKGIVVNLPELRLYYFEPTQGRVITFPIGIGREGWNTPVGLTTIESKTKNPTWYVPESIRAERKTEGVELPKIVPPGPDNPLGDYKMRLAIPGGSFLIHGTNDPSGVGRRSSSGCIRMLPEDIEELYALVGVGAPVQILNEPNKIGWDGANLYLESHVPLEGGKGNLAAMVDLVSKEAKKHHVKVDWEIAREVVEYQDGIPTIISVNPNAKPAKVAVTDATSDPGEEDLADPTADADSAL